MVRKSKTSFHYKPRGARRNKQVVSTELSFKAAVNREEELEKKLNKLDAVVGYVQNTLETYFKDFNMRRLRDCYYGERERIAFETLLRNEIAEQLDDERYDSIIIIDASENMHVVESNSMALLDFVRSPCLRMINVSTLVKNYQRYKDEDEEEEGYED